MPRISVVVPVYNVERYLAACLESLAGQTVRDLEVVMVDDGSSDSSVEIAERFARGDGRFRLVRQDNHGLGHARNTGVRHSTGEFLAFVDSDDIVPREAYEMLLGSLDATGSDFATGNVRRLTSTGTYQSRLLAPICTTTRQRTHVTRFTTLLYDRIAPNKLWRRSFWDAYDLRFPEGVLYEDISVVVPAHVRAQSVDVIRQPVYLWRVRETGERSITQRRTELRAVTDRMRAVDVVSRFLAERNEEDLKRRYDQSCVADDVRMFLQKLDQADDEFRALFLDLVNDFLDRAHPDVFAELPAIDRLKYHLVRERRLPELLEVLQFDKAERADTPVRRERGGYFGDYPFRHDARLSIPRDVYRLGRELRLISAVDDLSWDGNLLRIEGHAYVSSVDLPGRRSSRIALSLHEQGGAGRVIDLPVCRVHRQDVTAGAAEPFSSYDWSGFRTEVEVRRLRPRDGWRDREWRLRVEVRGRGVVREGWVGGGTIGRGSHPPHRMLADRVRAVPSPPGGVMSVEIDVMRAAVHTCRVQRSVVELHGLFRGTDIDVTAARVRLSRRAGSATLDYPVAFTRVEPGPTPFVTRIPLADVVGALELADRVAHGEGESEGVVWDLALTPRADAPWHPLAVTDDFAESRHDVAGREVVLERTPRGRLALADRTYRPIVTAARWERDGTLTLAGAFHEPSGAAHELVLRTRNQVDEPCFALDRDGTRFEVRIPVAAVPSLAGTLPLPTGDWELTVRPAGGSADAPVDVKVDHGLIEQMPVERYEGGRRLRLRDRGFDSLTLEVGTDLGADEAGAHHQHRLQTREVPALLREPLLDEVLFDTCGTGGYGGDLRALHEELAARGVPIARAWSVSDGQAELPGGLRPLRRRSRDWYAAMARARYVVSCGHRPLERWVPVRPGQVVVVAGTETPIAKVGFDLDGLPFVPRDHYRRLRREVDAWRHLVSPNAFATEVLRRAYRYQGDVIEAGSPRNDVLHDPDRDRLAASVRERLGIAPESTVVLYAPVSRDNPYVREQRHRLDVPLDPRRARAALGDDHVLLFLRPPDVTERVLGSADGFVRDVSGYPEPAHLLLVADVLVTDYSPVMVDFANTGRPIVLFGYDHPEFPDSVRGLHLDLPAKAPGPLVRTADELLEAVGDAARWRKEYDDAYRTFTAEFCPHDDGRAAARVVQAVFG